MIQHFKKKIYLIGSNPLDISDLTFQAINKIKESDVIILSKKFDKEFSKIFEMKKIIYEEDLKNKPEIPLLKRIIELFSENNLISYLVNGDPIFDHNFIKEKEFFKKHGVTFETISGVIEISNNLNLKLNLLTNREKNSSVTILKTFNKSNLNKVLKNLYFEKLVVYINKKNEFLELSQILRKISLKDKISVDLLSINEIKFYFKFDLKDIEEIDLPCYIIIDNNEKT